MTLDLIFKKKIVGQLVMLFFCRQIWASKGQGEGQYEINNVIGREVGRVEDKNRRVLRLIWCVGVGVGTWGLREEGGGGSLQGQL